MPWIANRNGDTISPNDADSTDDLTCPHCHDPLYIRSSYTRSDGAFVARHFSHYPSRNPPEQNHAGSGGCTGESDTHQRLKSITLSKLRHRFSQHIDTIDTEVQIDDRRADLAVTFTTALGDLDGLLPAHGAVGDKLAVEVQYRNETKDKPAVTNHYLTHGYSVLWLDESQFSGKDVELLSGTGQTWIPCYPNILDPDIHPDTQSPTVWNTHHDHIDTPATPTTSIPASIPPHWYTTPLKKHLATNTPGPQYKRWVKLFPDVATRYRELVELKLEDPERLATNLTRHLYPLCDPHHPLHPEGDIPPKNVVCGNCRHHTDDAYRDGNDTIVCWRNQPDEHSNRPRKLTLDDDYALGCPSFTYSPWLDEDNADALNVHPTVRKSWFLDTLRNPDTEREQRKAVLKYAYYQTWGLEDWCGLVFNPGREEALLRELNSNAALPPTEDCS